MRRLRAQRLTLWATAALLLGGTFTGPRPADRQVCCSPEVSAGGPYSTSIPTTGQGGIVALDGTAAGAPITSHSWHDASDDSLIRADQDATEVFPIGVTNVYYQATASNGLSSTSPATVTVIAEAGAGSGAETQTLFTAVGGETTLCTAEVTGTIASANCDTKDGTLTSPTGVPFISIQGGGAQASLVIAGTTHPGDVADFGGTIAGPVFANGTACPTISCFLVTLVRGTPTNDLIEGSIYMELNVALTVGQTVQLVIEDTNSLNTQVVASRVSGPVPLAVHFDGTGTISTTTTRPFSDPGLYCEMDFGDGDCEGAADTWAHTGKSKCWQPGPGLNFSHVYESAGTYTATLHCDDGTTVESASIVITSTAADTVFATTDTICVANSSPHDAACPAGATQVISSNFDAMILAHYGNDRRVLFETDDTFEQDAALTLTANTAASMIGAYGSGADPIVNCTIEGASNNTQNCLNLDGSRFLSVQDLNIQISGQFVNGFRCDDRVQDLLIMGSRFAGGTSAGVCLPDSFANDIPTPTVDDFHDKIFLIENVTTEHIGWNHFLGARRLVMKGNTLNSSANTTFGSFASQGLSRIKYARLGDIGHNLWQEEAAAKTGELKLHALKFGGTSSYVAGIYNELWTVHDNVWDTIGTVTGNAPNGWLVVGPQNRQEDERNRDVVVARNTLLRGNTVITRNFVRFFATERWLAYLNICLTNGGDARDLDCVSSSERAAFQIDNLDGMAIGNTYFNSQGGTFQSCTLGDDAGTPICRNNLHWAPLDGGEANFNPDTATNLDDPDFSAIPFIDATPTAAVSLDLNGNAGEGLVAVDAGTDEGDTVDYGWRARSGAATDVGAWERGGALGPTLFTP